MNTKRTLMKLIAIALLTVWGATARAQNSNGGDLGIYEEEGYKPYGAFKAGDIDTVNILNLKLDIHVPLVSYPQRGKLHMNWDLRYTSQMWDIYGFCPLCNPNGGGTWYYTWQLRDVGVRLLPDFFWYPQLDATGYNYDAIEAPDGTRHPMSLLQGTGTQQLANDASGYGLSPHSWPTCSSGTPIIFFEPTGIRIKEYCANVSQDLWLYTIEDTNGNKITQNSDYSFTDSLGRAIPNWVSSSDVTGCTGNLPNVSSSIWTLPGLNGGTTTYKMCYANIYVNPPGVCTGIPNCTVNNGPYSELQSVVLPNGTAWTFEYDSGTQSSPSGWGDLIKIIFPTGGSISYTWISPALASTCFPGQGNKNFGISRAVATRTVDANDGQGPHTWTYTETKGPGNIPMLYTSVQDPLGSQAVHTFQGIGGTCAYYETLTQTYQGTSASGTLLKIVQTDYFSAGSYSSGSARFPTTIAENVVPIRVTTILADDNLVTKAETDYDSGLVVGSGVPNVLVGEVVAKREYAFGTGAPGAAQRTTTSSYLWQSNSNYSANNIFGLPTFVQIRDGSGTLRAYATYEYDEYGLNTSSGASASYHDTAPANGAYRGNLTSTHRWLNGTATSTTNCPISISSGGYAVSYVSYFDTGMPYQATDACGSSMGAANHTTTFGYSSTYQGAYLTSVTNPLSQVTSKAYDFNTGVVTSVTDADNQTASITYDNMWRPEVINTPDGGQITITRQESSLPFAATLTHKLTSSLNKVSINVFDGLGRVKQSQLASDPAGTGYVDTTYDPLGRVATVSNPYRSSSDATYGIATYQYDALGRVTKVIPPDGTASSNNVSTVYRGNFSVVTDQAGKQRRSFTDTLGRLTEVDEPDGSSGTWGAASASHGMGTITISGQQDSMSGTLTVQVGSHINSITYGPSTLASTVASSLAAAINSDSTSPVTAAASAGVVTLTAKTTGSVTDYPLYGSVCDIYAPSACGGNPTFAVTVSGIFTGGADAYAGSFATNDVTSYTYDTLDNLTNVMQAGSRPRTFAYDSLSRLTSSANPEANTEVLSPYTVVPTTYSYDANGNVISKVAPLHNQQGTSQVTTTYNYDYISRLLSKTYSDGTPGAYYYYDAKMWQGITLTNSVGRLAYEGVYNGSNWLTSEGFSYDPMGRIVNNSQCLSLDGCVNGPPGIAYTYDYAGDLLTASGAGVEFTRTYGYDAAARVTQITSSISDSQHPGTLVSGITYAPSGVLKSLTLGNGLTETAAYNTRMQRCRFNVNSSSTTLNTCSDSIPSGNVQDYNYGFNLGTSNNGNVASWVGTGSQAFSRSYTYDALNRLLTLNQASGTPGSCSGTYGLSWTYDTWGNRTNQNVTSGTCYAPSYAVDGNNRLIGAPYVYDTAGNMTNDGNHTYTYDAENRLVSVDGGSTASYIYDAHGRRVQKTASSLTTDYLYGLADEVITERTSGCSPSPCWSVGYIYLGSNLLAQYSGGTTYFTHKNHLGSTHVVTSVSGAVSDAMDFLPFGQQVSGGSYTTHKFTGKERDAESGLDNFGARYNASGMGRFMSPDPLGGSLGDPQSLNRYTYVLNNPLRYTDPTGMYVCADDPKDGSSHCASKQDQKFEKTLAGLRGQDGDVGRAAAAYGAMNDDNGVKVGFADLSTKGENGNTVSTIGTDANGNLRANSDVTINSKISGDDYAAAVGHEGSHAADAQDVVKSGITGGLLEGQPIHAGMNITPYQSEQRAYGVTNAILSSQNQSRKYECGMTACTLGKDSGMPGLLQGVIDQIVAHNPIYNQGGQPMGPNNQGPSVVNGVTPTPPKASVPH